MNALGTALREARQIAGLSQSDLGRAIGRTQNNLSEIESGRRHLGTQHVREFILGLPQPIRRAVAEALSREIESLGN